ncbi:hypothetical protein M8C21_000842 [Ambrosia artemisiifolia]|uniref:PHD-type domain-containing protein n=1 Tax=Ambrosia artemisiifolia TaxID=4212 RepID=A0AAD5CGW0_AMBAR|nr:hypothetical protein M8C21_000842 [Ambrosia artemisiifolia]
MGQPLQDDVNVNSVRSSPKRHGDFGAKCKSVEGKRRKKAIDGRNDANVEIRDRPWTDDLAPTDGQSSVVSDRSPCVFCHSSGQSEGSGLFLAYAQGKEVTGNADKFSNVIHVHAKCLNWTPRIYFEEDTVVNLDSEIARANRLKCSSCGKKGASLGCWMKSCQRTYHVPCAYDIPECRWDDAFLLLCPKHASRKFPGEQKAKSGKQGTEKRYYL